MLVFATTQHSETPDFLRKLILQRSRFMKPSAEKEQVTSNAFDVAIYSISKSSY